MTFDCVRLTIPQGEQDLADYDWDNFLPSRLDRGRGSFTIIDELTGIEGKLVTRNAYIHGQVEGLVFAEHVTIEKTGRVGGRIFCRNLTVLGQVHGAEIVCDNVLVRSGGRLSATLKYKNLKIEQGGTVAGRFERRVLIDARAKDQRVLGG